VSLLPFLDENHYEKVHNYDMTIDMGLEAFAEMYRFFEHTRGLSIIKERDQAGIRPS
jgi:hypothetical protein